MKKDWGNFVEDVMELDEVVREGKKSMENNLEEYKVEALKEAFDGERTDVFTKHVYSRPESIGMIAREFVKYHQAERFNVWMKVKV